MADFLSMVEASFGYRAKECKCWLDTMKVEYRRDKLVTINMLGVFDFLHET